ncbi:hypothetical protein FKP32DRAFT_667910 [Trametes sanguinea]|nr:hypothetical protein FKP32DRAFT_667910 [Trametes sanguinea]
MIAQSSYRRLRTLTCVRGKHPEPQPTLSTIATIKLSSLRKSSQVAEPGSLNIGDGMLSLEYEMREGTGGQHETTTLQPPPPPPSYELNEEASHIGASNQETALASLQKTPAIEAETSVSSINLPAPTAPKEQFRQRAEFLRGTDDGRDVVLNAVELSDFTTRGAQGSSTAVQAGNADPEAGSALSQSSSRGGNVEAVQQTAPVDASVQAAQRRKGLIHFFALCVCLFVNGWNDGTTGPMLPRIQENYHVGFAVVSLIFVFNAIGYLTGAFVNVFLTDRFGFGKVLFIGNWC